MAYKVPMTLVTGTSLKHSLHQRGLTLIEIVLVLGLVALASTIVITNFASFAEKNNRISTEETLIDAIRYARTQAAKNQTLTQLYFDKETGALIVRSNRGSQQSFALDERFNTSGYGEISFALIPPAEGYRSMEAPTDTSIELDAVFFDSDRSSTPFNVSIKDRVNPVKTIVFDPFSHFPVETKK
jgi:prepilin-type N-terminal cleavage/methylation domain-containing protein